MITQKLQKNDHAKVLPKNVHVLEKIKKIDKLVYVTDLC